MQYRQEFLRYENMLQHIYATYEAKIAGAQLHTTHEGQGTPLRMENEPGHFAAHGPGGQGGLLDFLETLITQGDLGTSVDRLCL
jgi:hypothetical protein